MNDFPTPTPARDLTPEEYQERFDQCRAIEQKVKDGLRAGRVAMWETARALHQFDEEVGWSALRYESLAHWLAEVGMGKTMYYRLVSCYRETVVLRRIDFDTVKQLDPSKVDVVLPALKKGEATIKEALGDVEALGWRDLREQYQSKPPPDDSQRRENDTPADDSQRSENDTPPGFSQRRENEPTPGHVEPPPAGHVEPPRAARADGEVVTLPVKDLLKLREAAEELVRSKTGPTHRHKLERFPRQVEKTITGLLDGSGP